MDLTTAFSLHADMYVNATLDSIEMRKKRRQYTVSDLHAHIGLLHVRKLKMKATKERILQLKKQLEEETMMCDAVMGQTITIFKHVKRELNVELNDCPICLEQINTESDNVAYVVECMHAFHISCLTPWLTQGKNTCPICRQFPMTVRVARVEAVLYGKTWRKSLKRCRKK